MEFMWDFTMPLKKIEDVKKMVYKINDMKSKLMKHSMAVLIIFLIFALSVNSTLSSTVKNVKKIF